MIGRMIAPFGAMMSLALGAAKFRKLRFQMIADTNWTDIVPEDPVVRLGAGRSLYRVEDLVELVGLIERLRRELSRPSVKVITRCL
ncbi:MAG: DUF5372 family protein [Methylocella sp.]